MRETLNKYSSEKLQHLCTYFHPFQNGDRAVNILSATSSPLEAWASREGCSVGVYGLKRLKVLAICGGWEVIRV